MLFNTPYYIFLFLPLVLFVYFALNRFHLVEAAKWFLVFASIVFYSWWDLNNLPILLFSILCNWAIVNAIWRAQKLSDDSARRILMLGLLFNIAYLGCFKYYDFLAINANEVFGSELPMLDVVLPLGISFFTLVQITYLVDARERLVRGQRFQNYALFVLFFPHLIIGPILHHKDMMPQFEKLRTKVFVLENLAAGLVLFGIGFAKKVLIADPLSPYVALCFDESVSLGMVEGWQAALAFTCQLYFDFSGYIDMALGSALMLNIRMPENFNSPLRSKSIIEFWSRWHMTLTNFLTTYIYTPILYRFKKLTFSKSLMAVFATFFISGIWHGAAWTFILFGTLHGVAVTINHLWRRNHWPMPAFVGWLITFLFVCCSFVVFRAQSIADVVKIFSGMIGLNGLSARNEFSGSSELSQQFSGMVTYGINLHIVALILVAMGIVFLCNNSAALTLKFTKLIGSKNDIKKHS
jgi:D-alanyl-lipoteichoic acid acyltransferase DltB (MBOAT superfamily)